MTPSMGELPRDQAAGGQACAARPPPGRVQIPPRTVSRPRVQCMAPSIGERPRACVSDPERYKGRAAVWLNSHCCESPVFACENTPCFVVIHELKEVVDVCRE